MFSLGQGGEVRIDDTIYSLPVMHTSGVTVRKAGSKFVVSFLVTVVSFVVTVKGVLHP